MFERYTEKARQVIFFARYEASQFDSSCIETEHLLLGLLRNDLSLTDRFKLTSGRESIREQIKSQTAAREKVLPSVDVPLSIESKRVLAYGAEEAQRLNHKHIGTDHLLLGLLREESSLAAAILNERGLHLSDARQEIARAGVEKASGAIIAKEEYLSTLYTPDYDYIDGKVQGRNCSEPQHGSTQTQILLYLRSRQEQWGINIILDQRVQVSPTRIRVSDVCVIFGESDGKVLRKTPFLCIEVLSPEDRMSRLLDRVDDYLAMGVAHVWVVDPKRKAAFQITPVEGWREVKDGVLRTQDPFMDVPLAEIFA